MEKFAKENEDFAKCTKDWLRRDKPLKKDKHSMYSTGSLTSLYCFATVMLCILFGKPDINKFSSEWLPLLDSATNATIMDWDKILSDNLATTILNYRSKRTTTQRIYPSFLLIFLCDGCNLLCFQVSSNGLEMDYSRPLTHSCLSQGIMGFQVHSIFLQDLSWSHVTYVQSIV